MGTRSPNTRDDQDTSATPPQAVAATKHTGRPRHILKGPTHLLKGTPQVVAATKHTGRPRHLLKGPTHIGLGHQTHGTTKTHRPHLLKRSTKHTGRPRHIGHTSAKTHPEGADTPPEGDSSSGRSDQTHGTTKTPPEGADTHRTRSPNTWDDQDTSATPPEAVHQTHGTTKTHRPRLLKRSLQAATKHTGRPRHNTPRPRLRKGPHPLKRSWHTS